MNKKQYYVRIKTIDELVKEYPNRNEYTSEINEVYEMIEKYGDTRTKVSIINGGTDQYYNEEIKNDENLRLNVDDRYFYEYELEFIGISTIKLPDNLFEL